MEKSMIKLREESLKNVPFYQQWFYHGKQWLYRGRRPNWIAKLLNGMWARTASKSVMSNGLVALEVIGRKSGRIVSFPLVMVKVDGQRYVASMLGDNTQWVRNVRASGGKAVLRSGGREEVQLVEIPARERAPILKAYLQVASGARPHVPVDKDAPLAEFEMIAPAFPVFRLASISSKSPAQTKGLLIRWASFYDLVVDVLTLGQAQRLRKMTLDQALLKPGESLLDVGCGTGGVTIPGKIRVGQNGKAAGIDPSPEMIAAASQKASRIGLEIEFRLGVIESLPYPDAAFDVVTSSLMMHHLSPDLQVKGLAEVYRVLKPGGRLLVADTKRPTGFIGKHLFASLAKRHGIKFGIEDLPEILKSTGFSTATQLDERFRMIGLVRAVKPTA